MHASLKYDLTTFDLGQLALKRRVEDTNASNSVGGKIA